MTKKKETETVISDKVRGNIRTIKTRGKDGQVETRTEPIAPPKPEKAPSKKGSRKSRKK